MWAEWGILNRNISDDSTIGTLKKGEKAYISSGKIFGKESIRRAIGKITITIMVNIPDEDLLIEQANGFAIGKLVFIR